MIEILPNAAGPVIVNGSLQVAQAILLEAGLSYLGLGDPGNASWGVMLYEGSPRCAMLGGCPCFLVSAFSSSSSA